MTATATDTTSASNTSDADTVPQTRLHPARQGALSIEFKVLAVLLAVFAIWALSIAMFGPAALIFPLLMVVPLVFVVLILITVGK